MRLGDFNLFSTSHSFKHLPLVFRAHRDGVGNIYTNQIFLPLFLFYLINGAGYLF